MIKIELATQNELDRVKEIAEACAKNMIENNIFQWNDKYPSREIFKEDIKNNSLYPSKMMFTRLLIGLQKMNIIYTFIG